MRPVPAAQPQAQRSIALIPVDQATEGLGVFYEGILNGLRGAASRLGGTLMPRLVRSASLTAADLEQTLLETDATDVFLVGIDPPEDLCLWLRRRRRSRPSGSMATIPACASTACRPPIFTARNFGSILMISHRGIPPSPLSHRHTIRERVRGFEAAAASQGVTTRVVRLPSTSRSSEAAYEAMEAILAENQGFTAAFCMNDMMAVGVMEALANRRLSIPQDFALMGLDDLPCAAMTMPRLTTMRVDREAIGQEAYHLMQRRRADPGAEPRKVELAVRLVEGATVQATRKPDDAEPSA